MKILVTLLLLLMYSNQLVAQNQGNNICNLDMYGIGNLGITSGEYLKVDKKIKRINKIEIKSITIEDICFLDKLTNFPKLKYIYIYDTEKNIDSIYDKNKSVWTYTPKKSLDCYEIPQTVKFLYIDYEDKVSKKQLTKLDSLVLYIAYGHYDGFFSVKDVFKKSKKSLEFLTLSADTIDLTNVLNDGGFRLKTLRVFANNIIGLDWSKIQVKSFKYLDIIGNNVFLDPGFLNIDSICNFHISLNKNDSQSLAILLAYGGYLNYIQIVYNKEVISESDMKIIYILAKKYSRINFEFANLDMDNPINKAFVESNPSPIYKNNKYIGSFFTVTPKKK